MRSFFSKFKFKWWSWELDAVKLLPALLIVLAFLPVLPYEKKDGELVSVLGFDASAKNFYFVGWKIFSDEYQGEDEDEWKEGGGSLYPLVSLWGKQQPEIQKQKEYLLNQGATEQLATCIVIRDTLLSNYFFEAENRTLLNKYPPSPVPAIWLARSIIKNGLDLLIYTDIKSGTFAKLRDKCSEFKNMAPPKGYLEGDFSYEK